MKGIVRGVCGLALALAAACTNDATVDVGGDFDEVKVNREALFVSIGDSSEVLARLVNDLNTSTPTTFTVSNVGTGIAVNYDATYRPDYTNGDSLVAPAVKTQQRYWVVGMANGAYEFTLSSAGASQVVRVYVTPKNLGAALSKSAGVVAGETLTITAPAGLAFSPTSAVTFTTGTAVITSRAADGSSITFLVGPGVTGPATVTLVKQTYSGAPAVSLVTTQVLAVPAVTVAPTTLSTATPNTGASFTVALGGGLRFSNTGKVLIGGVEAGITALSADSSTATVVAPLNAAGAVTFTDLVLNFLPSVKLALPSDGKTVTPSATFGGTTQAGTDAFATAPTIALPTVVGQSVVVTDNGNVWGTPAGCVTGTGADNCKVYKIVVPAGQTFTLRGIFDTSADIGFYRFNSTFSGQATIADALGQSATNTESGTLGASLAAGTYYIMVAYYGPASYGPGAVARPTVIQLKITRTV